MAEDFGNVSANATAIVEDETGFFVAYGALVIMALIPIYVGSYMSAKKTTHEPMTQNEAFLFPLYASGVLFSLYILFKYLGPEYLNLLVSAYFLVIGVGSLTTSFRPFLEPFLPKSLSKHQYHIQMHCTEPTTTGETKKEEMWSLEFDRVDIACAILAVPFCFWYTWTKHWIANNILGMSFAVSGVAILSLGKFQIACLLLAGLFVYDVFWVFGTDVMVTVAKNFDAPIKVVFPKDFLELGINAKKFAMLGLGDIVIPGIAIALLLRFDQKRRPGSCVYFTATYIAYIVGLLTTIAVMHFFKAAQPALLYLSPACSLTPIVVSLIRGETAQLFAYADEEAPAKTESAKSEQAGDHSKVE